MTCHVILYRYYISGKDAFAVVRDQRLWDAFAELRVVKDSEGWMIRLETLVELKFHNLSFSSLSFC